MTELIPSSLPFCSLSTFGGGMFYLPFGMSKQTWRVHLYVLQSDKRGNETNFGFLVLSLGTQRRIAYDA